MLELYFILFFRFHKNKLPFTHRVLIERRGAKSPLLMVCSLLSYSDSRLRFCRSWKVLTLRQLILLAFSSLEHKDCGFVIHPTCLTVLVLLCVWAAENKDEHIWWRLFCKSVAPFSASYTVLLIYLDIYNNIFLLHYYRNVCSFVDDLHHGNDKHKNN